MRRQAVLLQRRKEYSGYVKTHYEADRHTDEEAAILRQICVDVPRTCSGLPMFQNPVVQKVCLAYFLSSRFLGCGMLLFIFILLHSLYLKFVAQNRF